MLAISFLRKLSYEYSRWVEEGSGIVAGMDAYKSHPDNLIFVALEEPLVMVSMRNLDGFSIMNCMY